MTTQASDLPAPQPDDPGAVYENLCAGASSRKQRSLGIIHAACRAEGEKETPNFSYAHIGRLSAAEGGPSADTINNPPGQAYRELITAWARSCGTTTKAPPKASGRKRDKSRDSDILDSIDNAAMRAHIGAIIEERNDLRRELEECRNTPPVIEMREDQGTGQTVVKSAAAMLSAQEQYAVASALDDDAFSERGLSERGWTVDDDGRVRDAAGETLFAPGFLSALRKVREE